MAYPWTRSVGQLRRRALIAGAVAGVGRVVRWLTPVAIVYVAWSLSSPWGRYLAPAAGLALLIVVFAAAMIGAARARHSDIYLAKWIDLRSGLDDRLTSAVEWSSLPTLGDFERRCIDELALQLGARYWTLVLPPTAPRQWPITLALVVVLGSLPLAYVRHGDTTAQRDARARVAVAPVVAQQAAQQLSAFEKETQTLKDPQLEQLSTQLSSVLHDIDSGTATRERSLERLERLRDQIERTAGARPTAGSAAQGGAGPVAALSRAVAQGSATGTAEALTKLEGALAEEKLSDEEVADLVGVLEGLAGVARPVDAAIAARLDEGRRKLAAGDQRGAGTTLAQLSADKLTPLERSLATAAALARARDTVESVTRAIGGAVADEAQAKAAPGTASTTAEGAVTASAAAATRRVESPPPDGSPTKGQEVVVRGTWSGKVMRQLFESSTAPAPTDEAARMLVEHERVVEERFQRDEVPQEYEEAVRAYFAALHRKGR